MDTSKHVGGFFKGGTIPDEARAKVNHFAYEISLIKKEIAALKEQRDAIKAELHSLSKDKTEYINAMNKEASESRNKAKELLADAVEKSETSKKLIHDIDLKDKLFIDERNAFELYVSAERKKLSEMFAENDKKSEQLKIQADELDRLESFLRKAADEQASMKKSLDLRDSALARLEAAVGLRESQLQDFNSELKAKEKNLAAKFDDVVAINAKLDGKSVDIKLREDKLQEDFKKLASERDVFKQELLIYKSNLSDFKKRQEKLSNDEDRLQGEIAKVEDMRRAILKEN